MTPPRTFSPQPPSIRVVKYTTDLDTAPLNFDLESANPMRSCTSTGDFACVYDISENTARALASFQSSDNNELSSYSYSAAVLGTPPFTHWFTM